MLKVAYCCEPQIGGTFSFFKRIRPALSSRGIDLRCIPPYPAGCFTGTRFAGAEGVDFVSFPPEDLAAASELLINHLLGKRYDMIMVLPGCDVVCTNLVRYLPRSIRATARIPMITRGTYAPARAWPEAWITFLPSAVEFTTIWFNGTGSGPMPCR